MILAVTGHRPHKLGGYNPQAPMRMAVKQAIRTFLVAERPELAITGMAIGVDQDFAELCIELGIPYIAAVPFRGQENRWPQDAQNHYRQLLAKAADLVFVSPGTYAPYKMQVRNIWMVDRAEHLLAIWDGSAGGTANCVSYAMGRKRPITQIEPLVALKAFCQEPQP